MTCTIGYVDGNQVHMATDSATTDEDGSIVVRANNCKCWTVTLSNDQKILVGFAGNCPEMNLFRYSFVWPRIKTSNFMKYLVDKVMPQMMAQLKERFHERGLSWNLLIGIANPGRLFVLDDCGDVEESIKPYVAMGSAAAIALGALEALRMTNSSLDIEDRMGCALVTAEEHHSFVRKPFYFLNIC